MALSGQAVPNGYVYVRACVGVCVYVSICMSAEKTAQNARLPPPTPPPLLSVLYPPDSLMSNLLSLRATWLQNLPNLPCLKEMMWAEERQGRSRLEKE